MNLLLLAQIIGGGFAALGGIGGFVAWFKARSETRKIDADAAAVVSDAASRAIQRNENEITRLEGKVVRLERELDGSIAKVRTLSADVDTLSRRLAVAQQLLVQNHIQIPWAHNPPDWTATR